MSETNRPTTSITLIWERELCEQLGRSKWSLDRWIKSGRFPPPINVTSQGRAWRLRDIKAWLDIASRSHPHLPACPQTLPNRPALSRLRP